jgi:hypothetical protein
MARITEMLKAMPVTPAAVIAHVRALETASGLRFADTARHNCRPGYACHCPRHLSRCQGWTAFEAALRAKYGESE